MNHMNNVHLMDTEKCPFWAWECITIQLKHRDIDLIIRKEA